MHPDPATLATLFAVALLAAGFDAIAGGGGLMTLPSLLLAGLDPVAALATNKLQSSGGSVSSTVAFTRRGLVDWRRAWPSAATAGLAAIAGALSASHMPRNVLASVVPLVLLLIAGYFARGPHLRTGPHLAPRPAALAIPICGAVGFYDGIFGPGAGSFYMMGFVALLHREILPATAHTKLANAASNLGALLLFAASGKVNWPVGLTMAIGAGLGGQIGSRLAIRHGARLIRPLLVTICCVMALKLLSDPAHPLRQALERLLHG